MLADNRPALWQRRNARHRLYAIWIIWIRKTNVYHMFKRAFHYYSQKYI